MYICDKEICTACGACIDVCPQQCIRFDTDVMDSLYPVIDDTKCTNCGLCHKTCPNNTPPYYYVPQKALAAWSNNIERRETSASGGIADELYRLFLSGNGYCVGVTFTPEDGALFIPVKSVDDIQLVKNSKYTYSNTNGIFRKIKKQLTTGQEVLFVGLPCQVSGLLNYLKKPYGNLTTVDLICHGVAPTKYIQQHIAHIGQQQRISRIYWRDPAYHTYTYTFTAYNEYSKLIYKNKVLSADTYQLGYHRALIYRDNCYNCRYAKAERVSDLTIGDFSGLGQIESCDFNNINVSCILVNTTKGEQVIKQLGEKITTIQRPLAEALNFEKQLSQPSVPHPNRHIFTSSYRETSDFEKSAKLALSDDIKRIWLSKLSLKTYLIKFAIAITTPELRSKVKKILKSLSRV